MPISSKELRNQIVSTLQEYAGNNPEDYDAYITACIIGWHYRDSPSGMSTVNQRNMTAFVHELISALVKARESDDVLNKAHVLTHKLHEYLVQKLKDKGYISADDHELVDDGLLDNHADDFSAWANELPEIVEDTDK